MRVLRRKREREGWVKARGKREAGLVIRWNDSKRLFCNEEKLEQISSAPPSDPWPPAEL